MKKKKNAFGQMNKFFSDMTSHLPGFATFEKVLGEFLEHKDFAIWVFVRVILPIIIFHAVLNICVFERFRLSPTIFGVAIFFYAAFMIDLDSFFNERAPSKYATRLQRVIVLLFAPIIIYYMLSEKIKPLHMPYKYFHRTNSMLIFSAFLFVVGLLVFFTWWDALFFALLGALGYATHLVTDRIIVIK
ncbi:MAG: hypothetical protein AABW59_01230 [archaeon]